MARKFTTFEEFLAHHSGDVDKAARAAFVAVNATKDDNETLTEEKRTLKEALKEAKSQLETAIEKLPKEGSVVISKEDSTVLESYKALGKPDEVLKTIEDMKKSLEVSALSQKLTSAGVSEKALKLAILLLQSEKDVYFTEKEEKGVKTSELNVTKLRKDNPSLFAQFEDDADDTDETDDTETTDETGVTETKKVVRVVTSTPGKKAKEGDLGRLSRDFSKGKYKGPPSREI
jgi:hypothetical protein